MVSPVLGGPQCNKNAMHMLCSGTLCNRQNLTVEQGVNRQQGSNNQCTSNVPSAFYIVYYSDHHVLFVLDVHWYCIVLLSIIKDTHVFFFVALCNLYYNLLVLWEIHIKNHKIYRHLSQNSKFWTKQDWNSEGVLLPDAPKRDIMKD